MVSKLNLKLCRICIVTVNIIGNKKMPSCTIKKAPRGFGSWEEGLFIFRKLGRTSYYFRGAGEQTHTFGDFGSTAKKLRKKFRDLGRSEHYLKGSREHRPPVWASLNCTYISVYSLHVG